MQAAVKFFNRFKRFGYTAPRDGSRDVDLRSGDIQHDDAYKALSEGQKVEFKVSKGPQAKNVRVVETLGNFAAHNAAGIRSSRTTWQMSPSTR